VVRGVSAQRGRRGGRRVCGGARRGAPPPALPLSARPVDRLLVVWWVIFWFTVMFTDLHNFTASVRGVSVAGLEPLLALERPLWPPPALTYVYYRWARTVDPLLYANPVWWQCIEWLNLCTLMPFSAYAAWAFAVGDNRAVKPAFVIQAFTFYSLVLCIGSTLFGDARSGDPVMFAAIYVPYLVMPVLVLARLWPAAEDGPFSHRLPPAYEGALTLAITTVFAVFASYVLKWFVLCEPTWLGAALPLIAPAARLPGGSTCPVSVAA